MLRFVKLAVVTVVAVATAHWWLPAAISLCSLLVTNFAMIRQATG